MSKTLRFLGELTPRIATIAKTAGAIRQAPRRLLGIACVVVIELLVIGMASGVWLSLEYREAREEAHQDLQRAGQQASSALAGMLSKLYGGLVSIRTQDLRQGQLALTTRLLQLETQLGSTSDLYIFALSGKFIAGDRPLPVNSRNVAGTQWFGAVIAGTRFDQVALVPVARSPMSATQGIIVARAVPDSQKVPAIIGATIPEDSIEKAVSPAWLGPTTRIMVQTSGGAVLVEPARTMAKGFEPDRTVAYVAGVVSRVAASAALPSTLSVRVIVPGWPIEWKAEQNFLQDYITENWPTLYHHFLMVAIGVAALITMVAAAAGSARFPTNQSVAALLPEVGTRLLELDADWIWELDRHGNLSNLAGNFPVEISKALRRSFIDVLEVDDRHREQCTVLSKAIASHSPVFGIKVAITREGEPIAATFELSGQPNERTGGYWGVAVRLPRRA